MAAAHRPRVLFLHTTALSDAEYTAYFDALHDIMDEPDQDGGPVNTKSIDETLEAHVIGIREARAWMRGRFRDMGNLSNVDKVCLIQFGKLVCLTELYGVLVVFDRFLGCSRLPLKTAVSRQGSSSLRSGFSCMHGMVRM